MKLITMRVARFLHVFVVGALSVCLSSCDAVNETIHLKNAVHSRLPAALQNVSSQNLSVSVFINNQNKRYIGEILDDGTWVVRLRLETLDVSYQYRARWTALVNGQEILVMEQSGNFFANASSGHAQVEEIETLSQGAAYDSDCDGQTNLVELTNGGDPLNSPGCAVSPVGNQGLALPEMTSISAGCFGMGSPDTYQYRADDEVYHQVCLDQGFEIGKYEVTFAQYLDFATAPGTPQQVPVQKDYGTRTHPVVMVTWADAVAYTRWLSGVTGDTFRLPTEAEWEYAARAGTDTPFWSGNTIRGDQENFNSEDPYGGGESIGFAWGKVLSVGSLAENPWGLYDILGNAIEWTCSGYDAQYRNELEKVCVNGTAPQVVLRGATHYSTASGVRASHRYPYDPNYRDFETGFRVVRVQE